MISQIKIVVLTSVLWLTAGEAAIPQSLRQAKPAPGVLFTGTNLPSPPQQGQTWSPPKSRLPEKWGTAVAELRRHGLADPRGCEYREVKITWGSVWSNRGFLGATHAWMMPITSTGQTQKDVQRFAVAWNGLVYPVVEIGETADLKADVDAMLKRDDEAWKQMVAAYEQRAKQSPQAAAFPPHRLNNVSWEGSLVQHDQLHPLKIAMVLLLGEGDLAERAWTAWDRGSSTQGNSEASSGDPYLLLATELAWAQYDRAIGARLRGDDVISMVMLQQLVALQVATETVAEKREIPRPRHYASAEEESDAYIYLCESPERILADETRRVKAGPIRRVLEVGLRHFPDQKQRIAGLIRDLEVVDATQEGEPGGVSLSWSPIVQALIAEGQPAVEPLLKCLETDQRLTRSVGFGRSFHAGRYFISVDEAAFETLCGILKTRQFGSKTEHGYRRGGGASRSMETRLAVAAEIREFWKRHTGQSEAEIWLATLADSKATTRQWLEAAGNISRPVRPKSKDLTDTLPPFLAGESLRGKTDPSVADLLAQRANEIAAAAQNDFAVCDACDMTLCLARWDVRAALPTVRRRIDDCQSRMQQGRGSVERLAVRFAVLVEAAVQAGDDAAVEQYAGWLRRVPSKEFSFCLPQTFMPLWRHPENSKMAELSRWMFRADDSPWHPPHEQRFLKWHDLLTSPLLGVPTFRTMLREQLANVSPVGQYDFYDLKGGGTMYVGNMALGLGSNYTMGAELPALKQKQSLRTCDFYAMLISRAEGAPRFELYWSEARRDAVVKRMAAFLDRWGDRFRDTKTSLDCYYNVFDTPRFRLARLSRPATQQDVAAGRAVFSLLDGADVAAPTPKTKSEPTALQGPPIQVRVIELKPYPSVARWKTLKQFPLQRPGLLEWTQEHDPEKLKKLPHESFDREGLIWQAEEAFIDGAWRRCYGFVGNHVIAKVPAEEIEIIERFGPSSPRHDW